ncbi:hypothetical protein GCM10009544_56840 [Streptomyces stramineus]|uniref:Uncharacterized protein n=1 Tax=Streptomyces stramineus TaxID=173861 RepID=A0ABN1B397_9ACTN
MDAQGRRGSGAESAGSAVALLAALVRTAPSALADKPLRKITWGDVQQWAPRTASTAPHPETAPQRPIHLPAGAAHRLHEFDHRPSRRPLFATPLYNVNAPVEEVRRSLTER